MSDFTVTIEQLHELGGEEITPYLNRVMGPDLDKQLTYQEAQWILIKIRLIVYIETLQIYFHKNMERVNVKSPTVH